MNTVAQAPNKEVLTPRQRWLEVLTILAMALLLGVLIYHQAANTGFFTAKFGSVEMVCLYGPILFAVIAPAIRALTGHRNPARPFEVMTSLCLTLGSLWLLIAFPFNYMHLADILPVSLRFILTWITDDVSKLILLLQVIITPISALLTAWKFLSFRRREPATLA